MNEHLKEAKKYTKICIDDLERSHLPNEQWEVEDAVTLSNLQTVWQALEAIEVELEGAKALC